MTDPEDLGEKRAGGRINDGKRSIPGIHIQYTIFLTGEERILRRSMRREDYSDATD